MFLGIFEYAILKKKIPPHSPVGARNVSALNRFEAYIKLEC